MGDKSFRSWIESNKHHILEFLKDKDFQSSGEILRGYRGERDIYQVRNALNELEREGLVEYEKRYLNSKYWKLKQS